MHLKKGCPVTCYRMLLQQIADKVFLSRRGFRLYTLNFINATISETPTLNMLRNEYAHTSYIRGPDSVMV